MARNSGGGRDNGRSSSPPAKRKQMSSEPEIYGIYDGKVTNIMDFGCFVQLDAMTSKEGLVHVAQVQPLGQVVGVLGSESEAADMPRAGLKSGDGRIVPGVGMRCIGLGRRERVAARIPRRRGG